MFFVTLRKCEMAMFHQVVMFRSWKNNIDLSGMADKVYKIANLLSACYWPRIAIWLLQDNKVQTYVKQKNYRN